MEGTVTEALPNAIFKIDLDNNFKVLGYVSGNTSLSHP